MAESEFEDAVGMGIEDEGDMSMTEYVVGR